MAMQGRRSSGSGAGVGETATPLGQPLPRWERDWREADAVERAEQAHIASDARTRVVLVALLAFCAAAFAAILPLRPGFTNSDVAASVAAAVTAGVTVAVVYVADRFGRRLPASGAGELFVLTAALASAGAAAVHFAVAKMHFDEYTLFGVFFVLSGVAQLVWPIWLLFRRWTPLIALGAVGNALIVALWAVDRIWGLPLGPTPWKPDPFAFGDTVTSAFEVVVVACCAALLVRGRAVMRPPTLGLALLTAVLTTLALLSVLGVASSILTPST